MSPALNSPVPDGAFVITSNCESERFNTPEDYFYPFEKNSSQLQKRYC